MGTKADPGRYDCFEKAKPDEPMFVLLARDPVAWFLVESWVDRMKYTNVDPAKLAEATACAEAMRAWRNAKPCLDPECRHLGSEHEAGDCNGRTIYGGCDCYGFRPNVDA